MSQPQPPGGAFFRHPWDVPHGQNGRIDNVIEVAALGPGFAVHVVTLVKAEIRMMDRRSVPGGPRVSGWSSRQVGPTVEWTMDDMPFEDCVRSLRGAAATLEVMKS